MNILHKTNNYKFIIDHLDHGKVRDVKENIKIELEWEDIYNNFDTGNEYDNYNNTEESDDSWGCKMIKLVVDVDFLLSFDYYHSYGILDKKVEIIDIKYNYPGNLNLYDIDVIKEIVYDEFMK